jgi:hypothetical protein
LKIASWNLIISSFMRLKTTSLSTEISRSMEEVINCWDLTEKLMPLKLIYIP